MLCLCTRRIPPPPRPSSFLTLSPAHSVLLHRFHPPLLLCLAFPNIFSLKITVFSARGLDSKRSRHCRLAPSTCMPVKTRLALCVPSLCPIHLAVAPGEMVALADVEDGSPGGRRRRRQRGGEPEWFLSPSRWQREMGIKLRLGCSLESPGRSTKPARARKEHMAVVCGSQWHFQKNRSESCAWWFNCCGHQPSFLPKSKCKCFEEAGLFSIHFYRTKCLTAILLCLQIMRILGS